MKFNLTKLIIPSVIVIFIGLCSVIYSQVDEKICEKASNESVQKIAKVIEIQQEHAKEDRQEQKALNKELLKAVQSLHIQVTILNEKTK